MDIPTELSKLGRLAGSTAQVRPKIVALVVLSYGLRLATGLVAELPTLLVQVTYVCFAVALVFLAVWVGIRDRT